MNRRSLLAVLVALVLSASACGGSEPEETIDVFAAASLTDALTDIAERFEEANPEVGVRLNFAGSSTLREQIIDGAEADVFVSANTAIMDELVDGGHVGGTPDDVATNGLVLATPAGNPEGVSDLADLADDDLFVGMCSEGVPCGDLAQAVLAANGVEASVDTFEPNVNALTTRLVDGELDAALLYRTEVVAAGADLVAVVAFPQPVNSYPIAVVDPGSSDGAEAFVDFVLSAAGQALLTGAGFGPP